MTTLTVTDLEAKALRSLALNYFTALNGGEPQTFEQASDQLWSNCLDKTDGPVLPLKQMAALCGTLTQKGMLVSGGKGRDSWIAMTLLGWQAYVAARDAGRFA